MSHRAFGLLAGYLAAGAFLLAPTPTLAQATDILTG